VIDCTSKHVWDGDTKKNSIWVEGEEGESKGVEFDFVFCTLFKVNGAKGVGGGRVRVLHTARAKSKP
jgi:hypothetical protein